MSKEMITFGNIEIEKFHHQKNMILLEDIDIDSLLISTTVFFGEKKL